MEQEQGYKPYYKYGTAHKTPEPVNHIVMKSWNGPKGRRK